MFKAQVLRCPKLMPVMSAMHVAVTKIFNRLGPQHDGNLALYHPASRPGVTVTEETGDNNYPESERTATAQA